MEVGFGDISWVSRRTPFDRQTAQDPIARRSWCQGRENGEQDRSQFDKAFFWSLFNNPLKVGVWSLFRRIGWALGAGLDLLRIRWSLPQGQKHKIIPEKRRLVEVGAKHPNSTVQHDPRCLVKQAGCSVCSRGEPCIGEVVGDYMTLNGPSKSWHL